MPNILMLPTSWGSCQAVSSLGIMGLVPIVLFQRRAWWAAQFLTVLSATSQDSATLALDSELCPLLSLALEFADEFFSVCHEAARDQQVRLLVVGEAYDLQKSF